MSVTEKHVYIVEGFGHWLAKDAQQARRAALIGVTAKRLTGGLDAQVVLLLPRLASFAGGFDPASQERNALVDEHRALAADVGVHVKVLFCVCHRHDDVVHQMLRRWSLVVLGGRKRIWWPTREERLASRLTKEGYPVVFAQVGAAPASSPLMDTARS